MKSIETLNMKFRHHWTNGCKHAKSEYVGSIIINETGLTWLDVYVFQDRLGQEVCIRYGSEDHQYYSPCEVINVYRSPNPVYQAAIRVLEYKGKMVWERKTKK